LNSVAPGQLISIFGANLAPPVSSGPPGGVAQSSDNLGVFFNGIPAPMLYSSTQQINVQVPFEIAGAATVQMQVVSKKIANPVSETRTLGVATRAPAIFLTAAALESPIAGWSTCGGAAHLGQTAVALNADGTLNDCTNPASAGTPVTVFLNGFGMVSPTLATGAIAPAPAVLLTPSMDPGPFTGTSVIATQTVPGAITGVAQAQLLPGGATLLNGASLGGVLLRDRVILVWTK